MSRLTDENKEIISLLGNNESYWLSIYFKLKEYEDLEEQGLLKKFECALGDIVYRIDRHNEIYECIVVGIKEVFNTTSYLLHASNDDDIRFHSWLDKCQIGYEFYLTKEEAEQELKRLESSE